MSFDNSGEPKMAILDKKLYFSFFNRSNKIGVWCLTNPSPEQIANERKIKLIKINKLK